MENQRRGFYTIVDDGTSTRYIYDSKGTYLIYGSLLVLFVGMFFKLLLLIPIGLFFLLIVAPIGALLSRDASAEVKEHLRRGGEVITSGTKWSSTNPLTFTIKK